MGPFLTTEVLILELLTIVTIVAVLVRRLRVPYTVGLVLVGLSLTLQHSIIVTLTPDLILGLLVPPLVFEAALHINFSDLRQHLNEILVLAVPGVILTTLIVGISLSLFSPLSLPLAIVFGALISATDPVAVVAMFRTLGVSKRLSVLVESESLLNDGTALVVFNIALAVALTGHFSVIESISEFIRVAAGGAAVGLLLGWIVSRLISRIDEYLIETTLTTLLAFGAYLIAESFHFSGVLAVVAAGLITGNLGPQGMSPTTRIIITNFWEYAAFLANSFIFLLIGLEINIFALFGAWQNVLIAVLSVFVARVLIVYGFGSLLDHSHNHIPQSWLHVINWGGLRGAIALALVLSLPERLGSDRELMKLMTFGVVLFTIMIQSTTMGPLLRRLGLTTRPTEEIAFEKQHARLTATRSAFRHLENRHAQGFISSHTWEILKQQLSKQIDTLSQQVREILHSTPKIEAEEIATAQYESLRAQRSALLGLRHDGMISQDVYNDLTIEIDLKIESINKDKIGL